MASKIVVNWTDLLPGESVAACRRRLDRMEATMTDWLVIGQCALRVDAITGYELEEGKMSASRKTVVYLGPHRLVFEGDFLLLKRTLARKR